MAGGIGSRMQDFMLEVAKGNVAGHYGLTKFGRNIEIDSTVLADIWDGGNTGGVSLKWVQPTAARIHTIVSSDDTDGKTGAPSSVGARTLRIWYLPDWDTKETTEDIILDGTTGVVMANAAVMINRMQILTKGATNVNVGIIKATAATDSTISARILAGKGRTNQAIVGIPSTQKVYISRLYANFNKTGGAAGLCDLDLLVNPEPADEPINYVSRHPFGLQSVGNSALSINFGVPKEIVGPCVIKLQALSGTDNLDVSAGFDGIIVDNTIGAL